MKKKAVFLDRDGVINVKLPEGRYVTRWEEFTFRDGAAEALRLLGAGGYLLIVVTNQRGIGRRLMSEEDLEEIHRRMTGALAEAGVRIDGIYHCPHDLDEGCRCRKPRPGMLEEALGRFSIDVSRSFIVGDSKTDMEAGQAVGVDGILVLPEDEAAPQGYRKAPSLLAAAKMILEPSAVSRRPSAEGNNDKDENGSKEGDE